MASDAIMTVFALLFKRPPAAVSVVGIVPKERNAVDTFDEVRT